ncbi:hypothetical protein [Sinomicrobium sp.]
MERDKLDRLIKEKLEARRITPSVSAWNSLEQQLENRQTAASGRRKIWLYATASAAAVLLLGLLLLENRPEQETVPAVVSTVKTVDTISTRVENKDEKVENKNVEIAVTAEQTPVLEYPESVKQRHIEVDAPPVDKTVEEPEVQAVLVQAENTEKANKEDEKVTGIVSKLLEINKEREVTDEDIEMLLAQAQREIAVERMSDNRGSIDAMALLDEVEAEMDQSFREKVLEALKEGLAKVGTALVNRN